MRLVVNENFIAQPFFGDRPNPNITPKEFVKGQTIEANEQMNFARQMFWVSSDGYIVDMTKTSMALNPIQQPQPIIITQPASQPAEKIFIPPTVTMPEEEKGIFTMKNLIMVAVAMLLIYAFFKYVLPLMKKSVKA